MLFRLKAHLKGVLLTSDFEDGSISDLWVSNLCSLMLFDGMLAIEVTEEFNPTLSDSIGHSLLCVRVVA